MNIIKKTFHRSYLRNPLYFSYNLKFPVIEIVFIQSFFVSAHYDLIFEECQEVFAKTMEFWTEKNTKTANPQYPVFQKLEID